MLGCHYWIVVVGDLWRCRCYGGAESVVDRAPLPLGIVIVIGSAPSVGAGLIWSDVGDRRPICSDACVWEKHAWKCAK